MSSGSAREYVAILFALVAAGACRTETGANPAIEGSSTVTWRSIADGSRTLRYTDADAALVPTFRGAVATGEITVRAFSGLAYLRGYTVAIYPSRVALTAAWRTAWGQPSLTTACWMVAAGWATELTVL